MQYKGFEVNDELIDKYVESLEISITEACDLILEEEGKVEPTDETKKAQSVKSERRYERSTKDRKKTEKVRKVDTEKGFLISEVKKLIEELGATDTAVKTETELGFEYGGNKYTFKLTKHRPPKKQAVYGNLNKCAVDGKKCG